TRGAAPMEANTWVVMELATPPGTSHWRGTPTYGSSMVRKGTIIMPPPMPSSPAIKPTVAPSASKAITMVQSIQNPFVVFTRSNRKRTAGTQRHPSYDDATTQTDIAIIQYG